MVPQAEIQGHAGSSCGRSLIRVRDPEPAQNGDFERLHLFGILRILVIQAAGMQNPVHQQVGGMVIEPSARSGGLGDQHREADGDIGFHRWGRTIGEGQHIGRVVLAAELAVHGTGTATPQHRQIDLRLNTVCRKRGQDEPSNTGPRQWPGCAFRI
jgi:hypothetical protein